MLNIVKKNAGNKYNGTVVVTEEQVNKIDKSFSSKFDAFCYGIANNWSKKSIMKYCLDTERDQYFYNYYLKYQASKSKSE